MPFIQQLRSKANDYRVAELERAQKMLARGDDPAKVLEYLSHGLTNKLLHQRFKSLKECSGERRESVSTVVQDMFHLEKPHDESLSSPLRGAT